MKSNWIATIGLSAMFLSGCTTVRHSNLNSGNAPLRSSKTVSETKLAQSNNDTAILDDRIGLVAYQDEDAEKSDKNKQKYAESQVEPELDEPAIVRPAFEMSQLSDGGQTFSLAELEQLALTNNPALSGANETVAKSEGLLRQVGTRPNPTLGYSGNQLADQATDQHTVFLEQEFVRGNKLALNQQVLRHTREAQQLETETQRYRVLTDLRVRFYEAIAAQMQLELAKEFTAIAQKGVDIAMELKEAGEGTSVDVLQSKTLLSEANLASEQAEAAYRGALNDLAAMIGIPNLPISHLSGELVSSAEAQDWENAYQTIVAQSPELAAANAIVCEKRANLQRQEVQAIPNLTAQIGAGYDRATDSGLINFQIGAPIPVRNKNFGNISAAHADYRRAVENVKRIEAAIKSRLARAAQEFEMANASVQRHFSEIIPQAKESLELSDKAYRAGELSFLQVLTVRRSFFEANVRRIESQKNLTQASAKVNGLLLTGGLEAPQDYTESDGLRGQSFGGQ